MGRVGVRVRSPQGFVGVRRAGGGELGWLGARPVGPPGGPKPKGPGGFFLIFFLVLVLVFPFLYFLSFTYFLFCFISF